MTFAESQDYRLPFGKHKGERIDDVAATDEGLKYLDWMNGLDDIRDQQLREALEAYLGDPTIAKDLGEIA